MKADRVVVVRRVLPASPDIVYDEWLDQVGMIEWMCLENHGTAETMMTIEHEQLPPDEVDNHQRGWAAISVQLEGALRPSGAGHGR